MKELIRLVRSAARLRLGLYAAGICYFLVLSSFPGVLLVLWLLRYTAFSAMDLISALETVVPPALMGAVEGFIVTAFYETGAAAAGLSAAAALWSAGRSVYALQAGLNRVYRARRRKGWLRRRLESAGYLLGLLAVLIPALVLHAAAMALAERPLLRQGLFLLSQTGFFALLYTVLPERRLKLGQNLPGALLTCLCWQALFRLFGIYAAGQVYSGIFGPVYTLALGMLWLYLCAWLLLLGGAVNRWLAEENVSFS